MIKFEKVSKKFNDGTIALADINLEIPRQDFVFIVGSSGAGKTTLLRLLIRELLPNEGKVLVDGEDLSKMLQKEIPQLRRKIGVVFQDGKLLIDRTVFENIALVLEVLDKGEKEIKEEVEEILSLVGLSEKANLFPLQLSGGEIQRTAIARAMVGTPQILLADEPTGDLDPANAWQILELLLKFHKEGTTVVMATHNVDIVNSLEKRVVALERGKIVKDQKKGRYGTS